MLRVMEEIKKSQPVGLRDVKPQWVRDVLNRGFSQDTKLRPTAEDLRDSFKTQQGLLNLLSHHDDPGRLCFTVCFCCCRILL